jgi:hypothetical protein
MRHRQERRNHSNNDSNQNHCSVEEHAVWPVVRWRYHVERHWHVKRVLPVSVDAVWTLAIRLHTNLCNSSRQDPCQRQQQARWRSCRRSSRAATRAQESSSENTSASNWPLRPMLSLRLLSSRVLRSANGECGTMIRCEKSKMGFAWSSQYILATKQYCTSHLFLPNPQLLLTGARSYWC